MATEVEPPVDDLKPQKKEVEVLRVLAEKVRGHVKWYSVSKCYGFISRNDDGGDLFVHRSVISSYSKRFPSLRNGEEVEFNVVETNQGIEATYVTGPGGQPVKGMRPMYKRYRTTSDPNTGNPEDPEQADHRPSRGPRRRGPGKTRSAGATESQNAENGHQGDDSHPDGEVHAKDSGADGESPNHAVPRQRRRPPRRLPRNRSAPAEGDLATNSAWEGAGAPVYRGAGGGGGDGRGHLRRFRRPFYARGGSRYAYNSWVPYDAQVMRGYDPAGVYWQPGDRNDFDSRSRRRPYSGGYSRGPRHRPRPAESSATLVNGHDVPHMKQEEAEAKVERTETTTDQSSARGQVAELEHKMERIEVADCPDSSSDNADIPAEQNA